jgi:DNA-binding transcriptional LysR family regulator
MHETNLSGFDLNLLVALDALLDERSVTRAARRVGISQPAMSHALRRLRDALRDPVLVREGRAMLPTPRAERMRQPLQRLLADAQRILRDEGSFDPATSTRAFSLACPDLLALLLPDLLGALTACAPGVRLDVVPSPGPDLAVHGDLWLGPTPIEGAGRMQRALGRVSWAIAGRRGHPAFDGRFSVKKWTRYPHIQVHTGDLRPSLVDVALSAAGVRRTIGVTVPSFLAALEVLPRTDYLFTVVRELAHPIADRLGLALKRPPLPLDDVPVAAAWHERVHAEPGHRWFRRTLMGVLQDELQRPRPALPR